MDRNCASNYVVPTVFDEYPIFNMTLSFDRSIAMKSTGRASILKNFLKICLSLVKDEDAMVELSTLTEEPEKYI